MEKTQPQRPVKCDQCRKKVEYGRDVITVERGVIGPRGPIPLDEKACFCSEECVANYFDREPRGNLPVLPPRIP